MVVPEGTGGTAPSTSATAIDQWIQDIISPTPTTISRPVVDPLKPKADGTGMTPVPKPKPTNPDAGNGSLTKPKPTPTAVQTAGSGGSGSGSTPFKAEVPRFPLINPPLHPKSETTFMYGQDQVSLARGMMVRMAEVVTDPATEIRQMNKRYRFRFLYNPESIRISSAAFAGLKPPPYTSAADTFQVRFAGQETISFGLMLDRTQEAYEQGIKTRGTLDDIEAFYRVINGNVGSEAGFLYLSRVNILWGSHSATGSTSLQTVDGYVTSVDIEHMQFTPRMCPIRTTINISVSRLSSSGAGTHARDTFVGSE